MLGVSDGLLLDSTKFVDFRKLGWLDHLVDMLAVEELASFLDRVASPLRQAVF